MLTNRCSPPALSLTTSSVSPICAGTGTGSSAPSTSTAESVIPDCRLLTTAVAPRGTVPSCKDTNATVVSILDATSDTSSSGVSSSTSGVVRSAPSDPQAPRPSGSVSSRDQRLAADWGPPFSRNPAQNDGCLVARFLQGLALHLRQRLARGDSLSHQVVECRHEAGSAAVVNRPGRCDDLLGARHEKGLDQSDPIVARRHIRVGAGAERRFARAEHHQLRPERQTEHLADLEAAVISARRTHRQVREQRIPLVEHCVSGQVENLIPRRLGPSCSSEARAPSSTSRLSCRTPVAPPRPPRAIRAAQRSAGRARGPVAVRRWGWIGQAGPRPRRRVRSSADSVRSGSGRVLRARAARRTAGSAARHGERW